MAENQVNQTLKALQEEFVSGMEAKGVNRLLANLAWECKLKVDFRGKSRAGIVEQLLDRTALAEQPSMPVRDTSGNLRAYRQNEAERIKGMHHDLSDLSTYLRQGIGSSSSSEENLSEPQGADEQRSSSGEELNQLFADYLIYSQGMDSSHQQEQRRASILSVIPKSAQNRMSKLLDAFDEGRGNMSKEPAESSSDPASSS